MKKMHSPAIRLGLAGASILGAMGIALVIGAGPTTAPTTAAPSTGAPLAAAAPALTPASSGAQPQSQDQQNSARGNRQSRTRGGGGGGRGSYGDRSGGDRSGAGSGSGPALAANDPYAILQERSIFVKGNQSLNDVSAVVRPPEPPRGQYVDKMKSQLIFNGVTIVNGHPEAFIEDLRSNGVGTVRIGDGVAGGTVEAINFDDLAYLADGTIRHVGLGQDFTGNAAFTPVAATPTTGPVLSAPGQVVGNGASIPAPVVTPSGLSSEDILARMKAKRAQEAQQIGK